RVAHDDPSRLADDRAAVPDHRSDRLDRRASVLRRGGPGRARLRRRPGGAQQQAQRQRHGDADLRRLPGRALAGTDLHWSRGEETGMIAALRRREAGWLALVLGGVLLAVSWPGLSGGLAPTVMSGLFLLFLAYAWNLVGGILGELSLSTMVFWAIGAYGLVLAGN